MSSTNAREGASFRQGIASALPIMLGYFPLAFAYGILAIQAGLGPVWITGMSILVYAGASQFMAVGMLAAGGGPAAIVLATLVINLRHLLMSAAVAPKLGQLSRLRVAAVAFHLTDETFSVMSMSQSQLSKGWLAGLQWGAYTAWVSGSAAGAIAGAAVPDPSKWGLDFALVAMFIALLAAQVKQRSEVLVALIGAIAYRLTAPLLSGHWAIIVAATLAATIGTYAKRSTGSCDKKAKTSAVEPYGKP